MADWSEVKFIPGNGTVRTVRINHSFEACVGRAFKEGAPHTRCCPFLRGYLEGFLSSWHGKSIKVEPSSCVIARGKFCELQVEQTQDCPSRKQQH
ncbi:MAG: hypothetical protein ACE5PO_03290 [Candidatus Bathyarchaeia archaeon]